MGFIFLLFLFTKEGGPIADSVSKNIRSILEALTFPLAVAIVFALLMMLTISKARRMFLVLAGFLIILLFAYGWYLLYTNPIIGGLENLTIGTKSPEEIQ